LFIHTVIVRSNPCFRNSHLHLSILFNHKIINISQVLEM
jgi:hypothetical protein